MYLNLTNLPLEMISSHNLFLHSGFGFPAITLEQNARRVMAHHIDY
jgi:hypothetical protein